MSRKCNLYAVHNDLSGEWANPIPMINEALAKRAFNELPYHDQNVKRHPDEYSLWECGTWDDEEGQIEGYNVPKLIQRGVEYGGENDIQESTNKE